MNVKFKYVSLCLHVFLMHLGTNSGHVISQYTEIVSPRDMRIKRQAGYVYDKPSVSFELPTATSIATSQAPTVDRIQMQMYYAYPAPASGTGNTVNVGQQNTGSSAGSATAVSSGASGYSYGAQNTQVIGSRTTLTETQSTTRSGYQNAAVTGPQAVVTSGSTGYGDGRPTLPSNSGSTSVTSGSTGYGADRPAPVSNSALTSVTSGSTGYGDGRPSVSNSAPTTGIVSTSAPRYLPPNNSVQNNAGISVTTNTQAQTITQPSQSYIPPSVQVSSGQKEQTATITQSAASASPLANPNTEYLLPNAQPAPNLSTSVSETITEVQSQSGSVPNLPTQQYIPPLESPVGQKTVEGSVNAPASTYLPPVF